MSESLDIPPLPAGEPEAIPQMSVGDCLRAAREARGLQVSDIAQTLKLGVRQVEALEQGNWQALPGHTFIRGFIRNYARLLQVDAAALMAQLDQVLVTPAATLELHEMRPAAMPHSGSSASRRDRHVMLFGAALLALAALLYFLMPADLSALRDSAQYLLDSVARKDDVATPQTTSTLPPVAPESVFPPGATPQQVMNPQALAPLENVQPAPSDATPAKADAPQLRFVSDKESWIEVRDRDNKTVFSRRMTAGTEQVVSGQGPLSISIGYAPGIRVFWHDQAVDLTPHTRGDVARLVLE